MSKRLSFLSTLSALTVIFFVTSNHLAAESSSISENDLLECAAFAKAETSKFPETVIVFKDKIKPSTTNEIYRAVEGAYWTNIVYVLSQKIIKSNSEIKNNGDLNRLMNRELDRQNFLSGDSKYEVSWECHPIFEEVKALCSSTNKCFISLKGSDIFAHYNLLLEASIDYLDVELTHKQAEDAIKQREDAYLKLSRLGYIDAAYRVAELYINEITHRSVHESKPKVIVGQNIEKAIHFYTLSADAGYELAARELSEIYWGVQEKYQPYKNARLRAKYLKISADNGNAFSASQYAGLLSLGSGVIKNEFLSAYYTKVAVLNGHTFEWKNISTIFFIGDAVDRNAVYSYAAILIYQAFHFEHTTGSLFRRNYLEYYDKNLSKDQKYEATAIAESCLESELKNCILINELPSIN